jgi:glycosyltransferase involved in cell wall biosynthesis
MLVAIDAVGIRGHGAAAILSELLCSLPMARPTWQWHAFLFERRLREFDQPPLPDRVTIETTSLGNTGLGRLAWLYYHLPNRLRQLRADVLFSFANLGAAWPSCPQVVFLHQLNALQATPDVPYNLVARARWRILRYFIRVGALASKAIMVQTRSMSETLLTLEPGLRGRVHVIPSGARTVNGSLPVSSSVARFSNDSAHPRLVYVSHPSEHKNHETLLKGFARIKEVYPAATLALTLERRDHPNVRYAEFVHRFEQLASAMRIEDNISWLGILAPHEVAFALRQADLLVFPSRSESFGLPLVEAMAVGCPVAAADLPYAHDVCDHAATYFDAYDSESLANCVIGVLRNECERHRLAALGLERSLLFSYHLIAERIAAVLEAATTNQ